MELVKCPFCGKSIEIDSFYCDQCSEILKICPVHKGFRKGKVCGECGTELILAKDASNNTKEAEQSKTESQFIGQNPSQTTTTGSAYSRQTTAQSDKAEDTVRPPISQEAKQLRSNQLNANLELLDGAVIGRRGGNYVAVFGSQAYISGTHARLQKNSSNQWEIVDLNSTNGTFLNGKKLLPNQPTVFKIGDTISFYNLDFIAE